MAQGRKVWIVGASSGIGAALAQKLAVIGDHVTISARDGAALQRVADAHKDRMTVLAFDVMDEQATAEAVTAMIAAGPPDLFIYCAGYWHMMGLANFSADQIARSMEVNLLGACRLLEPLLSAFATRGTGHAALVSSVAGWRGLPNGAAYGPTKAALSHLAECLKPDCDRAGIKLQIISPGFVDTPMTAKNPFPMPHLISVEDAASAIIAGLAGDRFEIHFPRRFTLQLKILGLLPDWLYFRLMRRIKA